MRSAVLVALAPVICFAQAPPRLALDAPLHDFGRIERDSIVRHRFKVTNPGGAPLRIVKLNASCGCTSTVVGKETLAPGEGTELEVVFNTSGLRGKVKKQIEVISDDPVEPSQLLTVEAEIAMEILVRPEEVIFRDLVAGDRRKAVVKLESATGRPIHVNDVEMSPAPWLGVATREKGNDLFLDLDLVGKRLPQGKASGSDTITLYVVNPKDSVITVRVQWERRVPVYATPARLALAGAAGQDLGGGVVLKHREGKPFRVLSARTTSSMLEVPGLPTAGAATQTVKVVLKAAALPGTYSEKVILDLDDPAQPVLEIRVAASLK